MIIRGQITSGGGTTNPSAFVFAFEILRVISSFSNKIVYRLSTENRKSPEKSGNDRKRRNAVTVENTDVLKRREKIEKASVGSGSVGVRSSNLLCSTNPGGVEKSGFRVFLCLKATRRIRGEISVIVYRLSTEQKTDRLLSTVRKAPDSQFPASVFRTIDRRAEE